MKQHWVVRDNKRSLFMLRVAERDMNSASFNSVMLNLLLPLYSEAQIMESDTDYNSRYYIIRHKYKGKVTMTTIRLKQIKVIDI